MKIYIEKNSNNSRNATTKKNRTQITLYISFETKIKKFNESRY